MKSVFVPAILFWVGLLIVGCSAPYSVIIVNDSGTAVQIVRNNVEMTIPVGGNVEVKFDERINETTFVANGVRFSYRWEYPGREFVENSAISQRFVIRIDPSLKAFVLLSSTPRLAANPPAQVPPFPLSPLLR